MPNILRVNPSDSAMKPILQALVLAERVYTDISGKKIIAGTFNKVTISKQPILVHESPEGEKHFKVPGGTDPGCPAIYISLTDVVDKTEITLQFTNVSKNRTLFGVDLTILCKNRLETVEIIAPLPPFKMFLNEAGTFSFDIVWEGEILGSHRVMVITKEEGENQ